MKKVLLIGLLMANATMMLAQATKDSISPTLQGNNEVKVNILYTLFGSPELTYERILSDHHAIGLSAEYRFFQAVKSDFSYGITPYFRRYFGAKKSKRFLFGRTCRGVWL